MIQEIMEEDDHDGAPNKAVFDMIERAAEATAAAAIIATENAQEEEKPSSLLKT